MKALILLSHGSRRRESNREMMNLAATIDELHDQPFDHVACAFQQFAQPTFDETVDSLVAKGVTHLVVIPLFLAAGSHVRDDVPRMIENARARHPQMTVTLTPHLGQTAGLAAFLLAQASSYA